MQEWECDLASQKSVSYTVCSSGLRVTVCVLMILSGSLCVAAMSSFVLRRSSTFIIVLSRCIPMTATENEVRGRGEERGKVRGRGEERGEVRGEGKSETSVHPPPIPH